ncbi:MAG: DUF3108 domain-containing protein [Bacteroidales bacterium]|jgi:hypothetical protein
MTTLTGYKSTILTLFLITLCGLAGAQEIEKPCLPVRDIPPSQMAFSPGEKLTIIASYQWGVVNTDVGTVSLEISETETSEEPLYVAKGRMQTARFFNAFFRVDDYYESRFNQSNLRPTYFMRDVHEGNYTIQNYYHYNRDHSINARIVRKDGSVQDTLLPGRICTFDFITLFYFLRNLEFSNMNPGDVYPISFAIDEEIFDLYLRFDGKDEIRIQGQGTFRCLKFSAQTVAGVVFDGKEDLRFWISDDRNRVPLYIESPVVVGRVTGRLGGYENLRFPLTSKIK